MSGLCARSLQFSQIVTYFTGRHGFQSWALKSFEPCWHAETTLSSELMRPSAQTRQTHRLSATLGDLSGTLCIFMYGTLLHLIGKDRVREKKSFIEWYSCRGLVIKTRPFHVCGCGCGYGPNTTLSRASPKSISKRQISLKF